MAWSCRGAWPRRAFGTTPGGRRSVVEYAAVVVARRAKMRVEGDIVVMVVVVVSGGDGELYGELKGGECLCGERYVQP